AYVAYAGAVWNGTVTASGGDLHVVRLDAASGTPAWGVQLTNPGNPPNNAFPRKVDLAVGPSGGVYVAGSRSGSGASQAVVAKLNPSTGATVWKDTTSGGTAYCTSLALDGSENVYVAGPYSGTVDFNPDPKKAANLSSIKYRGSNTNDAFVWKLGPAGAY